MQLQSEAQQVKAHEEFDQARQKLQAEYGDEAFDAQGNLTASILAMPGQTAKHLREAYLSAQKALEASALSGELEGQTYNDLYRFFARYYDDGDFISQRRYGQGNKYAIPYNGEEVFLYWANFDQYYVKTGETFADYRFTVEPALGFDAATVHFKLRQASVEQNNVKGDKRFFVLAVGDPVAWDPASRTLTIGFEYRPLAADEQLRAGSRDQQEKLNAETAAAVLRAVAEPLLKERIGKLQGEPGKEKSLLAKHLARYTARNTRDYFIHKDLGGFLRRELDFFLKNEVLHLEDLDWNQPALVQATAARLQDPAPDRRQDRRLPGADRGVPEAAVGEAQVRRAERLLRDAGQGAGDAVRRDCGQQPAARRVAEALRRGAGAGRRFARPPLPDGGHRLLRRRFQTPPAGRLRRPGCSLRRAAGARGELPGAAAVDAAVSGAGEVHLHRSAV